MVIFYVDDYRLLSKVVSYFFVGTNKKYIKFLLFLSLLIGCFFYFYPYSYYQQDIGLGAVAPDREHWFGTDILGRDILARVMYACATSLTIGLLTTIMAVFIGTIYGMIAGYCGGWVDSILMRIIDVLYPIPLTLVVILLMVIFGKNIYVLFIAMGMIEWMTTGRIIRSEVSRVKEYGFVQVSRCLGQSRSKIIMKHILPNIFNSVIVCFVITLPGIILLESFLSFLGIGIQPPRSSLGILISEGSKHISTHPWELIFPSIALVSIIFVLTILGDRLKRYSRM